MNAENAVVCNCGRFAELTGWHMTGDLASKVTIKATFPHLPTLTVTVSRLFRILNALKIQLMGLETFSRMYAHCGTPSTSVNSHIS
jgi:hypothetical protein